MRPELNREIVENVRKSLVYPVWTVLLLTSFTLLFFDIPIRYQFIPLAVSMVFLGLPHGAVDHLMIPRAKGEDFSLRWLAWISAVYFSLGMIYLLLWISYPVLAFVLFIVLTWFHWGEGELYIVQQLFMDRKMNSIQKILEVTVRGAAPMILPLIAFPEYYRMIADITVNLFTSNNISVTALLLPHESRALLFTAYIVTTVLLLATVYRNSGITAFAYSSVDILILTVFFITVPPILAVGLYFCLWHSARHGFRYSMLDTVARKGLEKGSIRPAIKRFVLDSIPLTTVALVMLAGLYYVLSISTGFEDLIGAYLVLIAVLTLPHVFFMIQLDRIQELY